MASPQLAAGLPRFVTWLRQAESWPNDNHRLLYEVLTDVFLLNEVATLPALGVLGAVIDARLLLGLNQADCAALMTDLKESLGEILAPATLDAITDLVETTVLYPTSCAEARLSLWSEMCARLRGWRGRLNAREYDVLHDIGVMLDAGDQLDATLRPPELAAEPGAPSRRLRVLLYTLQMGVAERVARLVPPNVSIETSHAADGERRLAELAARADMIVICWAAASHAATEAIQRAVVDKRRIVYPRGKGSSSALRAIAEAAAAA
jgi:hypothetical protein